MIQDKTYTLRGVTPLMFSGIRSANPYDPLVIRKKQLTDQSGKDRTDATNTEISDLEWMLALYLTPENEPCIPAENFERMFADAAGSMKKGLKKKVLSGLVVTGDAKVIHPGGKLDKIKGDPAYRLVKMMSVSKTNKAKILKTRPIFNDWSVKLKLTYDDTKLDERTISELLDYAGREIGLCDSRPRKGQFVVE